MTENFNLKKVTDFKSSESSTGENKQWDKDNQAWWDWYVSLADNSNSKTKEVLLELPEPPNIKDASKIDLKQQLSEPYDLTTQDISNFQKNGFIKLKKVLTPVAIQLLRHEILSLLKKTFENYNENKKNRFLSLEMMWLKNISMIHAHLICLLIQKVPNMIS